MAKVISKTFADCQRLETGQYKKVGYNTFCALAPAPDDNYILFYRNGICKKVKIIESGEYTYKFNRRSISAIGGAAGLFEFLEKDSRDFYTGGFFYIVLNGVFERL